MRRRTHHKHSSPKADGAMVDAYVVTDRPDDVAAYLREQGWARP